MKNYKVIAKVVSVVLTSKDVYHVCFQRLDTIEDVNNPFHGCKKMAVVSLNKEGMKQLMQVYGVARIGKLLNQCGTLHMTDDGSIFHKVDRVQKMDNFGFRTWPTSLPKFVTRDIKMAVYGEMYK